jgi:ABC-type Fe3+/spermidine/putrescine transport system ATPase subunit
MKNLLHVAEISKSYEGTTVVRDISFSLGEGEILCLLGPSGSGKTTLLRLLAGLEQPDTGQLLLNGRELATTPPHNRHFGMMFQEYALFPHKNVAGNIGFGLEMAKWSANRQQQRIREMLTLVGLQGKEKRRIDELSGGERQRVALARSLAPQPRLLLLDEPLGSLDRILRDRLAGEIRSILKSQQVTAVFVTHDQAEAFAVADSIAILRRGRLEQFAGPEEVYRRPATAAVAAFLGFRNLIDCARHPLAGLFAQLPAELKTYSGTLLIRPEGARLAGSHPEANSWPKLSGQVVQRRFQGQVYSMEIRVNDLQLHFDLPIDPPPPQIGAAITLTIQPAVLVRLREQTG